ncbi:MAG: ParB/RepB/Spo0J family partition protein [Thermoanaerobaculia bacterium]|nr:ParB/RepB/Spo0J family partition protein [Thermoanaerobaculia bacterium]
MTAAARTATKKRGLGRGLDALLQAAADPSSAEVRRLPVEALTPNENQPRRDFDEASLAELSASIKSQGLVQPIVVTPRPGGQYLIVAGERRWRASKLAGLESVPVVELAVSDDRHLLELALVENLQREDLNPIEEAQAYRSLSDDFGLSQGQLAERVGKARSTVANSLRLLNLPEAVLTHLRNGELTAGQARPLLGLDSASAQIAMARRAVAEGWTARELERRSSKPETERSKPTQPPRDVHDAAAEEAMTRRLQTKVVLRRRSGGKGEIRIHFHSEEELMRLYDLLMARESS